MADSLDTLALRNDIEVGDDVLHGNILHDLTMCLVGSLQQARDILRSDAPPYHDAAHVVQHRELIQIRRDVCYI